MTRLPNSPNHVDPSDPDSPRRKATALVKWLESEVDEVREGLRDDDPQATIAELLDVAHTALIAAAVTAREYGVDPTTTVSRWSLRMENRQSVTAALLVTALNRTLTRLVDEPYLVVVREALRRWGENIERGEDA